MQNRLPRQAPCRNYGSMHAKPRWRYKVTGAADLHSLFKPGALWLRRRLPLYLGAPNAATFAPPGSFINVLEHSPRQLARLLRHLAADEEAYGAYFEWRGGGERQGDWVRHFNRAMHEHVTFGSRGDGLDWVCKLCKVQHKYYDWPEDTSTE